MKGEGYVAMSGSAVFSEGVFSSGGSVPREPGRLTRTRSRPGTRAKVTWQGWGSVKNLRQNEGGVDGSLPNRTITTPSPKS